MPDRRALHSPELPPGGSRESTDSSRAGITNRGGGAPLTPQLKGQLPHPLLFSLLYFNTYINKHVLSPQHSVLTEVRSGCVGGTE